MVACAGSLCSSISVIQMSEDGRYHGTEVRRKAHRRQKTRPLTAAAAAADREMLNVGAESQLLHPSSEVLLVSDIDMSFGSPYRRRTATTTGRSLITQVRYRCHSGVTYHASVTQVSWMPLRCHSDATRYTGVTQVSFKCHTDITDVTHVSHRCRIGVTQVSLITQVSHRYHGCH